MKITYVFRSPTNSANVEQFSSKNSRKMALSTVFKISESESLSAQTSSEKESCGGIVSRQIILNAYYYIFILMLLKIVLRCLNGLLFFPQAFYPRCLIASPILDFLKIPHAVWIKSAKISHPKSPAIPL